MADARRLPASARATSPCAPGARWSSSARRASRWRWGSGSPSSFAAATSSARPMAASGRCSCRRRPRRAWRRALTDLLDRLQLVHRRAGRRRAGRIDRARRLVRAPCSSTPTRRWRTRARAGSCWSSSRTPGRPAPARWCCSPTTIPRSTRITDAHVRAGGYRTSLAFDGEAALRAIREQKPDAIVLNLMLPKRTGFDVLAEPGYGRNPRRRGPACWCCRRGAARNRHPRLRARRRRLHNQAVQPAGRSGSRAWGASCGDRRRGVGGAPRNSAPPGPSSEAARGTAGRPARGAAGGQPRVSYEDAERMARSGDTLRALEAFQALAAANPDDFDSRVWLGRLLTRVGRRPAR